VTVEYDQYCKPSIAKGGFAHFVKLWYRMKKVFVINAQKITKLQYAIFNKTMAVVVINRIDQKLVVSIDCRPIKITALTWFSTLYLEMLDISANTTINISTMY
jgi:hypothetical protein